MAEGLTAKEERFCLEYIIDYKPADAAIRAGYKESSARTQAWRMLKKEAISARVHELQIEYNKNRCFAEKERVLKELWDVYEKATQKTEVLEWSQEKHAYVPTGEWTFDGKTATKAMELIGKMNGMFTEKIEHNAGNGGGFVVNVMVDDGKDD